jgi:hypothetical protein
MDGGDRAPDRAGRRGHARRFPRLWLASHPGCRRLTWLPARSDDELAQELSEEGPAPNYAVADSARPPSWLIPVGGQETDALFTELADHDPNTRWTETLVDIAAIPASETRC